MRPTVRTSCTLFAAAGPAIVAVVYFVLAVAAWLDGSTWWDDRFFVGVAWLLAGLGAALVTRLLWAACAPERFLPRWLAIVVLLGLGAAAGFIWLLGAIADAMAGF